MFALIRDAIALGPEVLNLVSDMVRTLRINNAHKDRVKAQRTLWFYTWALQHGYSPADIIRINNGQVHGTQEK